MPKAIKLSDQNVLVNTSEFPNYAHFEFEKFNPVQSRAFEIFDKNCNALVSAATSSGKTKIAEMFIAHTVRVLKKKAIYVAPLKALAKEKIDDWTDAKNHLSDLKLSICTGDYRLTPQRKKELEEADIILFTPEMLSSRMRNFKSEHNEFLQEVGVIVLDEFHLIGVPGRGDHSEVGLMKFCSMNSSCRIVGLSATIPNVQELADWLGYLTDRETFLIDSKYRPCPLGIHFETFQSTRNYEDTEREKISAAMQIIEDYPDDKFLIFAHTKRTGEMMKKTLQESGCDVEFHNADLEKDKRQELETRFRSGKLQYIVATSGLAWGLNLPARRVIILGVHRGMAEVETYDIWQMAGRAGRVGFDPRGDVYILIAESQEEKQILRIRNHKNIESRLLDHFGEGKDAHYKNLAFHLVSEIHHGAIKTKDDVHDWYSKTLACFQSKNLHDLVVDATMELLIKCGAIKIENEEYKATAIGKVSSMFYFSPFDASDLRRNFKQLFSGNMQDNDLDVVMALSCIDSHRMGIVSKADKEEIGSFATKLNGSFEETEVKVGYTYFTLLNGLSAGNLISLSRMLQFDFERTAQVLNALDSMSGKWDKSDWFDVLSMRIKYGVKSELVNLCKIPNIGKARAERLYAAGLKNAYDVAYNPDRVQRALNMKPDFVKEVIDAAKTIDLTS